MAWQTLRWTFCLIRWTFCSIRWIFCSIRWIFCSIRWKKLFCVVEKMFFQYFQYRVFVRKRG